MSEKQNIRITVDHRGNTLYRNYAIEDGQVPEGVQKGVQEMIDTINGRFQNEANRAGWSKDQVKEVMDKATSGDTLDNPSSF